MLLVGSVDAANLVGSELAVRIAEQLGAGTKGDPATMRLLAEVTLYVVPRPSPDASAHVLDVPIDDRATNSRSTDADRDGSWTKIRTRTWSNGVITSLRVADPTGPWMEHPDDSRVLVRADGSKNETGQYRLYSEGVDNDHDEHATRTGRVESTFNQFSRSSILFAGDAGPHQVSEPESRADSRLDVYSAEHLPGVLVFAPRQSDQTVASGQRKWWTHQASGAKGRRRLSFVAQNYEDRGAKKMPRRGRTRRSVRTLGLLSLWPLVDR